MKHIKIVFFSLYLLSLTTAPSVVKAPIHTSRIFTFPISDNPIEWHPNYPSRYFKCNQPGAPTYEQFIIEREQQRALLERNVRAAHLLAHRKNCHTCHRT